MRKTSLADILRDDFWALEARDQSGTGPVGPASVCAGLKPGASLTANLSGLLKCPELFSNLAFSSASTGALSVN